MDISTNLSFFFSLVCQQAYLILWPVFDSLLCLSTEWDKLKCCGHLAVCQYKQNKYQFEAGN